MDKLWHSQVIDHAHQATVSPHTLPQQSLLRAQHESTMAHELALSVDSLQTNLLLFLHFSCVEGSSGLVRMVAVTAQVANVCVGLELALIIA